ncbi:hypothetical protein [Burkholderia ubonensis]|uniref:hypothetical protein n=1 Tax=Burkholderia ubonensis TaxID=101571 RepID=UPI002AB1E9DD|nr:hypothetical protein [Burkholderia ubonensis]
MIDSTIRIAHGARIDVSTGTIEYRDSEFTVDPASLALLTDGASGDLDEEFLLELSKYGLCYLERDQGGSVHKSYVIAKLVDTVSSEQRLVSETSFLQDIVKGNATRRQIIAWLFAMFSFTKSADDHLGEACSHANGSTDRLRWRTLLDEERHHWKIYRTVFLECGIDIDSAYQANVSGAVRSFVDHLKSAARKSPYHYASLLYSIEQGASHDKLEDDPFFFCLVEHYGFSRQAIAPLFRHTIANATLGHADVWFDVLKEKDWYSRAMAEDIIEQARYNVHLANAWYEEVRNAV